MIDYINLSQHNFNWWYTEAYKKGIGMALAKIRTSELRSMRHMTQATLAERAHLSKSTISNLESGNQTKIALDTIAKLCQALDCTPSDLFEFNENQQEKLLTLQQEALAPFIGSLEYSV